MSAAVVALRPNSAPAPSDRERKVFATLQAELALCGVPVERLADGSFVAGALFGPINLKDLDAVARLAEELGVA